MRALLLFLFLVLSWNSGFAQEKYFHDLRGFEDSTGTTHLFYRLFERESLECDEGNGEYTIYHKDYSIRHYNASSLSDSVKFHNGDGPWCLAGYHSYDIIFDYEFVEADLNRFFLIRTIGREDWQHPDFYDQDWNILPFPFPIFWKTVDEVYYQVPENFILTDDSIYIQMPEHTFSISVDTADWPDYGYEYEVFYSFLDSVAVQKQLAYIHPNIDSLFFFKDNEYNLFRSEKWLTQYDETGIGWDHYQIIADADNQHVYVIVSQINGEERIQRIAVSNDLGKPDSWDYRELPIEFSSDLILEVDNLKSGNLYAMDSYSVFESEDYGSTFTNIFEIDTLLSNNLEIKGIYKKPDSELLYILTNEELIELNVETLTITTLKVLPVSNESEAEIPSTIALYQNYPNPFNPSTNINYQLAADGFITLKVFDALGREVATLVNENKIAGTHSINFEASGLSSGIYFYRLEADGNIITKKLTLIK